MLVSEILTTIKNTRGTNSKKQILLDNSNNALLKRVLQYANDPYIVFNVVKVPKVSKSRQHGHAEIDRWNLFLDCAKLCSERYHTGNAALEMMKIAITSSTLEEEKWMRKVLKKHLAIGISTKTINSVFPGLIPTFDVQLAQKFEPKRLKGKEVVALEPKLDGIRCCAIVRSGVATLYARSGKQITNFDDTIGLELSILGDGFYDGEIMGKDFVALMRQAYRKENVDTKDSYLSLFDFLPLDDWVNNEPGLTCHHRRLALEERFNAYGTTAKYLSLIPRHIILACVDQVNLYHHQFVAEGYEGVMIKDLDALYRRGRGYEVMKVKSFQDADVMVLRIEEGNGKFKGMCGNLVVDYNGVEVGVGSGLNDELRKLIWDSPDDYIGKIVEVRYQEVTPDGSLRFPTFIHFRNDR
ncbi:MAG: hypothetical protein CME70_14125 [Halobacteriovorax sp.]|nr:hypothetical protein [Halobacteriovorax sp.]|tara:strand:+ start:33277 stop:34509 length:1233 start_codon:yes stop_codon:yes gene_type:complete